MTTRTNYSSREEWLKIRRTLHGEGIFGGSDAGALAGVSPWKSPYSLWAECTGRIPPEDESGMDPRRVERMRQGRDLEDYVARRFCERTGKAVHRVNALLQNEAHPYLFATIDRKVENEDAGLECKRMGDFAAMKMRGDIPAQYYAQCVTYMAATGYHTWYLAIMSSDTFRIWILTRDPEAAHERPEWAEGVIVIDGAEIDALDAAAAAMHGCVANGTPPEIDGSDATTEAIGAEFPQDGGAVTDLAPYVDILQEREGLKSEIAEREERVAAIENEVKAYMGEASTGTADGGWSVSWKNQTRQTVDRKALAAYFGGSIPAGIVRDSVSRIMRITHKTNKSRRQTWQQPQP